PAKPAWQRQAWRRGAEAHLSNAALPGAPGGRGGRGGGGGAAAAAAGARGARNGPGGAPAFPQTGAGGQGGRGRGGNTTLALKAEPAAFGALAGGTDELAPCAAALLARLTWPGKLVAADAPVVAPLTAPQQAMYEAGQTVY